MKLSKKTIDVLKSFVPINSNILIQPGNSLKTISVAENIIASAEVDEEFPQEFGIYNLSEFLGALSLFKEPDVTFSEKVVQIRDAQNPSFSLKYVGASKDILVYPKRDVKVPPFDVEFDLSQEQIQSILKGATVIGAPHLQVNGSEDGLFVKVCDRKSPTTNDFQLQISDQPQTTDFTYNLNIENIRLYPGDYKVSICGRGLSRWENPAAKITIYIALEV